MTNRVRKLCLLGDSGVGKTLLAARLGAVPPAGADGLWIYPWRAPGAGVECALWDLRGRCSLDSLSQPFLAHADGLALIADAGNEESIEMALQAGRIATTLIGDRPQVLILNRFVGVAPTLPSLPDIPTFLVSADTGEGVETAFGHLAQAASTP